MDLWKLLIVGVILVGLFLVFAGPPELPKLPEGFRVEEGTFRIVGKSGEREEIFGVYPVDAGFRVVSILHEKGKVLVEAELLYTPDWTPLAGTITQRRPAEMRWIFAFTEGEVLIRRQQGPRETSETLALSENTFPFDRDLVAPWYAIFRAKLGERLQILDVRTASSLVLNIGPAEVVNLRVTGRSIPVERRAVVLENQRFQIYRQGELLIGLRGEEFEAYLVEVLPEGIQEGR